MTQKETRPRIVLFTGDGKGKTTAALGMALRAAGHGLDVGVVQFIKNDASAGEIRAAAGLPAIQIVQAGLGFLPPPTDERFARHKAAAEAGLDQVARMIAAERYAMVVLDEICVAVAKGLLDERRVIDLIERAGPDKCVVLTGRDASGRLIELADTVTEMRCVKHAHQTGRSAQKGVEM